VKVASERLGHSKVGITLDLYSHVAKVDAAFQQHRAWGLTERTKRGHFPVRPSGLGSKTVANAL
jgi:hypothetical protein